MSVTGFQWSSEEVSKMKNQLQHAWFRARETNIGSLSTASLTKRPVKKLRFSGTNSTQLWSQLLLISPCRGSWRLSPCILLKSTKSLGHVTKNISQVLFWTLKVNFLLCAIIHTTRGFIYKFMVKNTVFRIIFFLYFHISLFIYLPITCLLHISVLPVLPGCLLQLPSVAGHGPGPQQLTTSITSAV